MTDLEERVWRAWKRYDDAVAWQSVRDQQAAYPAFRAGYEARAAEGGVFPESRITDEQIEQAEIRLAHRIAPFFGEWQLDEGLHAVLSELKEWRALRVKLERPHAG